VDGKDEWSARSATGSAHGAEAQVMNMDDIEVRHVNGLVMRECNGFVAQSLKAVVQYSFRRVPYVASQLWLPAKDPAYYSDSHSSPNGAADDGSALITYTFRATRHSSGATPKDGLPTGPESGAVPREVTIT
jgi:hypothetical protein